MVGDGKYDIKAPRFREFGDEVEGNCFEGKGILWFNWVERGSCFVGVHLVCLAQSAAFHIVSDKLLHIRPPVVAFDKGKSIQNSWMSGHTCVMVEV